MSQDKVRCRRLLAVLTCACILVSCKGSRTAATPADRYRRAPVVTVEPALLEQQNLLADAKLQQELAHYSRAAALYRQLLSQDASCGAANYELSKVLTAQLRLDSAVTYAERAVRCDPKNVWYHMQCANLYKNTGQGDKLTREWETIVQQNATVLDYYYELANAYMQTGDYKHAVSTLNRVEGIIGITESNSLLKEKIWNAAGDGKKANREIERLAAAMPHDAKYNAILAESYMKAGHYAKAKSCYDKVLAANPDDEYIHISLAQYYRATDNPAQAYQELKKGFANPKLDCQTKVQVLASFYTKEEFYDTRAPYAYDLLNDAMRNSTDSTAYALLYGDVLMRQGKYAEAAGQLKRYLAKDSSKYDVWEALLICENELGDRQETLDYATRAAALFPLHLLPYYIQAVDAYTQQRYDEALSLLRRCEKIGFTGGYLQQETYALLADCYHAQGDYRQTFAYYDKLLALNPDNATVLNNYAYYLSERGERLADALTMAEKAVKAQRNSTFLDTYAWVLYKLGRYDEARSQMKQCLEADKNPSDTVRKHWDLIRDAQ